MVQVQIYCFAVQFIKNLLVERTTLRDRDRDRDASHGHGHVSSNNLIRTQVSIPTCGQQSKGNTTFKQQLQQACAWHHSTSNLLVVRSKSKQYATSALHLLATCEKRFE